MKSVFRINFIFAVIVFFLAGCSGEPSETFMDKIILTYSPEIEDEQNLWPDSMLRQRFAQYWYKRFTVDTEGALQLEAPHFQFMTPTHRYENYISPGRAQLPVHIQISDISSIDDYLYAIRIRVNLTRAGQEHSVHMNDHWVMVQDDWYHLIKDPVVFPFTM